MATYTSGHGLPDHAIQLSRTMFRYLDGNRYLDALAVHGAARDAAERAGDVADRRTRVIQKANVTAEQPRLRMLSLMGDGRAACGQHCVSNAGSDSDQDIAPHHRITPLAGEQPRPADQAVRPATANEWLESDVDQEESERPEQSIRDRCRDDLHFVRKRELVLGEHEVLDDGEDEQRRRDAQRTRPVATAQAQIAPRQQRTDDDGDCDHDAENEPEGPAEGHFRLRAWFIPRAEDAEEHRHPSKRGGLDSDGRAVIRVPPTPRHACIGERRREQLRCGRAKRGRWDAGCTQQGIPIERSC